MGCYAATQMKKNGGWGWGGIHKYVRWFIIEMNKNAMLGTSPGIYLVLRELWLNETRGRRPRDVEILPLPKELQKFLFHTNPYNVPLTYQASRSHSLVSALRCASNSTHFVSRGTSVFDGSPEMNHDVHLPNGFIPPFPAFRRRMLAAALRSWNVVVKSRLAMVLCRLVGQ